MSPKWLNPLILACIVALLISLSLATPVRDEQDDYEDDSEETEVTSSTTQRPKHHHHVHVHKKVSTTTTTTTTAKPKGASRAKSGHSKTSKKPDEARELADEMLEEASQLVSKPAKSLKKALARSKSKSARTTTPEPSSDSDNDSDGANRSDLVGSEDSQRSRPSVGNSHPKPRPPPNKPSSQARPLPPSSPPTERPASSVATSLDDDDSKDSDADYNEEGEFRPKGCLTTTAKPSTSPAPTSTVRPIPKSTSKPTAGSTSKPSSKPNTKSIGGRIKKTGGFPTKGPDGEFPRYNPTYKPQHNGPPHIG